MIRRKFRNLKLDLDCFRSTARALILQSDDWGLDRMTSPDVHREMAAEGFIDFDLVFHKDGRESVEDLEALYHVLEEFRDCAGRSPVVTANFVMANPDFEMIEKSGYRDYAWIAIDDCDRRPFQRDLLAKWREGIERGFIEPQYHGRDHFSAEGWLVALRGGDPVALGAFRRGLVLTSGRVPPQTEYCWHAGGAWRNLPRAVLETKIDTGLEIFRRVFGCQSLTTAAPHYVFCAETQAALVERGMLCMQAASHGLSPGEEGTLVLQRRLLGEPMAGGMTGLARNCRFEPSQDGRAAISAALERIGEAFRFGYPAVLETHRLNFVSVVDRKMRDDSVVFLRELLAEILRRFPDVRFVSTEELAMSVLDGLARGADLGAAGSGILAKAGLAQRASWVARERIHRLRRNRRIRVGARVDGASRGRPLP